MKQRKRLLVSPDTMQPQDKNVVHIHTGNIEFEGIFHIKLTNTKTGEVIKDHSFTNLITNWSMNLLGGISGSIGLAYLVVSTDLALGSGSTPPTVWDETLEGEFGDRKARFSTLYPYGSASADSTVYYYGIERKFLFLENEANDTISEFGLFYESSPAHLFSRALYKDETGSITSFTKTSEMQLEVRYSFRMYSPTGSWSGTFDMNATDYSYTGSALNIDYYDLWDPYNWFGVNMGLLLVFGYWGNYSSGTPTNLWLYPSCSVLIHQTGSAQDFNQGFNTFYGISADNATYPYELGTFKKKQKWTINPAFANYGSIAGATVYYGPIGGRTITQGGHTQILFNPSLPKTDVDRLILVASIGWGRRVEPAL